MKYKITLPMRYVEAYLNCEAEATIDWPEEKMDRYRELDQMHYSEMNEAQADEYETLQEELYDAFHYDSTINLIDSDFDLIDYEYESIGSANIEKVVTPDYEQINLFDGDIT